MHWILQDIQFIRKANKQKTYRKMLSIQEILVFLLLLQSLHDLIVRNQIRYVVLFPGITLGDFLTAFQ